jgi:two-component system, OmpR family, phosphate regulon sensor histidine kinase PhoR
MTAMDASSDRNVHHATPRERIFAARFILIAAAAVLLLASLLWGMPLAYAAAALGLLVAVAGFVTRYRQGDRDALDPRRRQPVWPDTSMKATVEAFPHAAMVLDAAATVRYANTRASQLFPATRPGDPFALTFRWPEIGEALAEAQSGQARSIEFQEPGESSNVYSVTLSPIPVPAPGEGFILVAFDDVSDRLATARMRADFVANASHELRTPLAAVTGFIETLLGPARNDPAASEKFLRVMLDQARRMRRLIDDLLTLSRAEMRVYRRPTDRVDLVGVVRQMADALAALAAEHSVALSLDTPKAPLDVIGDRDELMQVVQNLVENAIRYGASGGRVEIRVEAIGGDDPAVAVHVKDFGPGIPPEHLPRLTERFYRVDVGASREMKGTGLGLAIVKHILTRHQSRLEVSSEPGDGATFSFELPLVAWNFGNEDKTSYKTVG